MIQAHLVDRHIVYCLSYSNEMWHLGKAEKIATYRYCSASHKMESPLNKFYHRRKHKLDNFIQSKA